MSNPDTNNIGIKLQAAGENLNTWGDPNLNNDLAILSNLASKFNSLTVNGDYTVSETNYATTNDTEVAFIKLVAGTVSAAFKFIMPGRAKRLFIWNATSFAANPKLSATTGFTLPAGGLCLLATDGTTDVYNVSPTHSGTSTQASDSNAYALWGAVQTAIANAGLPATAGTIRNSGTDTTAGYLSQKTTTQISGATTTQLAGLSSVQFTTLNAGGNEQRALLVSPPYVGGFLNGGYQNAQFTPVVGSAYDVDCTSAGVTVNLAGMTTPQMGQEIKINKFGTNAVFFLGTINNGANLSRGDNFTAELRYSGGTWGWNLMAGAVKSVQSGIVSTTVNTSVTTATITAVGAKAVLTFGGVYNTINGSRTAWGAVSLTNSTTVTFQAQGSTNTDTIACPFTVTDYY